MTNQKYILVVYVQDSIYFLNVFLLRSYHMYVFEVSICEF